MNITDAQRQQWIAALTELHDGNDPESEHGLADEILCEVLDAIGEHEIVKAWEGVRKWYG